MNVKVEKQAKQTIKLTITIPAVDVKNELEHVLDEFAKNTELPGFRKGLAPRDLVKEKADKNKLYGEVIDHLLQKSYPQALTLNLLH